MPARYIGGEDASVSRRSFLRISLSSFMSLAVLRHLHLPAALAHQNAPSRGRAERCILLFMNGGPSQIDTFDPKPGTAAGGLFKSIETAVPELQVSEHLPQVAAQARHLAVIRSMTSKEGNHKRARYLLHTGYIPQGSVTHPGLGSIVFRKLGEEDYPLPEFVSIGSPSYGGGALGARYDPFFIRDPTKQVQNLAPPERIDAGRVKRRLEMLDGMEDAFIAKYGPQASGHRSIYQKAIRMMRSPLSKAFDVSAEPEALRRAYGVNPFGQGCLMARRLVEAGVRFVEVSLDGWDTHVDNFERNRKLMGDLDPAFATLLKDLNDRDLLDTTLVIWMGEFGRTPGINRNEGRDHYPAAWTAALAGGGIRGGRVIGATSADGATIVDHPVSVPDLFATIAVTLGINPNQVYHTPAGRPIRIVDHGKPVQALL